MNIDMSGVVPVADIIMHLMQVTEEKTKAEIAIELQREEHKKIMQKMKSELREMNESNRKLRKQLNIALDKLVRNRDYV